MNFDAHQKKSVVEFPSSKVRRHLVGEVRVHIYYPVYTNAFALGNFSKKLQVTSDDVTSRMPQAVSNADGLFPGIRIIISRDWNGDKSAVFLHLNSSGDGRGHR